MFYFNIISNDLNNIILSYLDYKDVNIFSKSTTKYIDYLNIITIKYPKLTIIHQIINDHKDFDLEYSTLYKLLNDVGFNNNTLDFTKIPKRPIYGYKDLKNKDDIFKFDVKYYGTAYIDFIYLIKIYLKYKSIINIKWEYHPYLYYYIFISMELIGGNLNEIVNRFDKLNNSDNNYEDIDMYTIYDTFDVELIYILIYVYIQLNISNNKFNYNVKDAIINMIELYMEQYIEQTSYSEIDISTGIENNFMNSISKDILDIIKYNLK